MRDARPAGPRPCESRSTTATSTPPRIAPTIPPPPPRGDGGGGGTNCSRRIRRNNEVTYWAPTPRAYTLARLSLAGNLAGLNAAGRGRDLRVTPYVAGQTHPRKPSAPGRSDPARR